MELESRLNELQQERNQTAQQLESARQAEVNLAAKINYLDGAIAEIQRLRDENGRDTEEQ